MVTLAHTAQKFPACLVQLTGPSDRCRRPCIRFVLSCYMYIGDFHAAAAVAVCVGAIPVLFYTENWIVLKTF